MVGPTVDVDMENLLSESTTTTRSRILRRAASTARSEFPFSSLASEVSSDDELGTEPLQERKTPLGKPASISSVAGAKRKASQISPVKQTANKNHTARIFVSDASEAVTKAVQFLEIAI